MAKKEKRAYGYIYKAINRQNGKNYIGQTVTGKLKEDKIPIEERWKDEVREAYKKERNGERLRYIEKAIIKYGAENFDLKQEDIAKDQNDLDEKEIQYIEDYDSMNREKGYNRHPGGHGGRPSPEVMEYLSKIGKEKWNEDLEYREKQTEERRERAKDPGWLEKMTEINQNLPLMPEYKENMSNSLKEKWQDPTYQESVSEGVTGKWQEEKYRERQFESRATGKREIADKGEFLKDIQEMKKKDINAKYDMDGKCINKRIEEMLGHHGIKNYSEAKKYLEDKNLDDIEKEVKEREKDVVRNSGVKKEITDNRKFLEDLKNMTNKEMTQEYNMHGKTLNNRIQEMLGEQGVKNYTEAKNYLEQKQIDEVLNEINENLKNLSQRFEGKTNISDKRQFLEDVQNMQKKEIDHKYGMDAKTTNRKIEEMCRPDGPKNYTELKEHLQHKSIDEVLKEIEEKNIDKQDRSQSTEISTEESLPESNRGLPEKEDTEGSKNKDEQSENIAGDSEKDSTKEPSADISDILNAMNDYEGINEFSQDGERDIGGINENMNNANRDFAGINDIPDDHLKDFEGINNSSGELNQDIEDGEHLSDEDKGRDTKEFEPTPAAKESIEETKADIGSEKDNRDYEYA